MNMKELYLKTLNSPCTVETYDRGISDMLNYIGKPANEITKPELVEWTTTLKSSSSATQYVRIIAVKEFFRFLCDEMGIIEENPAKSLKTPKIHNKPKDSITKEQALEMLNWGTYRDKAIVAMYLSTGLRVKELVELKYEDYINGHGELKFKIKGGDFRTVKLNPDCMRYIDTYITKERKDGCDNLFVSNRSTPMNPQSLNNTLKKLAKRAGIEEHITNHTLRSTFVTDITKNHGIYMAQVAVGHKNISTTRRYVRGLESDVMDMMGGLSL